MSTDAIFKTDKSEVDMVKADPRDFIYRSECFKKCFHEIFMSYDMESAKGMYIYTLIYFLTY